MANTMDPVFNGYRTISLIFHPSKVMLRIILNSLRPHAEKIAAEEQAGFKTGCSTTEQIFNLRILCQRYLQHQQDLYHVFADFKKAFNRVWHAALWATMNHYNIMFTPSASYGASTTKPAVLFTSTGTFENGSKPQLG